MVYLLVFSLHGGNLYFKLHEGSLPVCMYAAGFSFGHKKEYPFRSTHSLIYLLTVLGRKQNVYFIWCRTSGFCVKGRKMQKCLCKLKK